MNNVLLVQAAQEEILQELLQDESGAADTIRGAAANARFNDLIIEAAKVRGIELDLSKTGRKA